MEIRNEIQKSFEKAKDKIAFINDIKEIIYKLSPQKDNPVDRVLWVPKEKVVANDYNPNHVAPKELSLLYTSIKEDGYTQPIVTIYDKERDVYVIVDGFHRNLVMKKYNDISERCNGFLPVVVMEKDINQRRASTVRHNRARGAHSVDGMVNIIFSMMRDGISERKICEELGLEKKEFEKLKFITGFAKIFKNYNYSAAIDKFVSYEKIQKSNK